MIGAPAEEDIRAACDLEISAVSKACLQSLHDRIPYLKGLIDQATQHRIGLISKRLNFAIKAI
jgi:hypothetical protein